MSATMSSPVRKRFALLDKSINARRQNIYKHERNSNSSSPLKSSNISVNFALRNSPIRNSSPTRNTSSSLSPTKSESLSNTPFVMFEETQEQRTTVLMQHMSLAIQSSICNDENDFENIKENMSPSKLQNQKVLGSANNIHRIGKRSPLKDLSIEDHKGYIENPITHKSTQLSLHINHRIKLPPFVTPPRDIRIKQYFTTSRVENEPSKSHSRSADDIAKDKVIRKLNFKIFEN